MVTMTDCEAMQLRHLVKRCWVQDPRVEYAKHECVDGDCFRLDGVSWTWNVAENCLQVN